MRDLGQPWRLTAVVVLLVLSIVGCGQAPSGDQAALPADSTNANAPADSRVATPAPQPDAGATLKIGYSTWVGYGPLFIARENQYYEQNGIQVELVKIEDPKLRFAALAAGQLDGLVSTLDALALYVKPELQLKAVLALDTSNGGDGIVATTDIASAADLKGKKVAFNPGSVSDFYINYVLQENGMSIEDVELVNMKQDDAGAAFVAGKVDAAVTWEPWLSRAKESPNGQILHDSSQTPGLIVDVLIFRQDVIEQRKTEVQGVIAGWMQAIEFYQANQNQAIEIMAEAVGGWLENPEDFASTLTGVQYYDAEDNQQFFGAADSGAFQTAQFAIDLWAAQGKVDESLKAADIIDNTLLTQ
ncbi:MAG: ABC transporter substrate-binding protein [Chloroflexales bacterium]|nr:ABC transporter substrate-binding protein [Chloroflexales bacterium]